MLSRRLVHHEGRSFEITWEDLFVETVEGGAEEEGEPQQRRFLTHQELEDFVERQVQRRLEAGFVEAPAQAAAPDDSGKARELEALIEAQLDSAEPYLVYADWLQGRGDPRGELIALQHRLAAAPTEELRAEEQRLLAAQGPALLGPLADCREIAQLSWRLGFVEKACLFVGRSPDYDEGSLLKSFLTHAACRFLRELTICDPDGRLDGLLAALLQLTPRRTVRRLQLGSPLHRPRVSLPAKLLSLFPALRELDLFALPLQLPELEHPSLSRLVVHTETTRAHVSALARSRLPALKELVLVHESPAWREADAGFLEELVLSRFHGLSRLAVRWQGGAPEAGAWRHLLRAPLVPRLEELELAAPFGEPLLALLVEEAAPLSRLALRVGGSAVDPQQWTEEHLAALGRAGLRVHRAAGWPPPELAVAPPRVEPEPEGDELDEEDDGLDPYAFESEEEYEIAREERDDAPSNDALDRHVAHELPPLYDETGGKDEQ